MSAELTLSRTLLPPGSTVLCAVSGGADSVCLLDLVRRMEDLSCLCAHFDHGLRPESGEDADFVRGLCESWGVPFVTRRRDVAAYARAVGESVETAGRELRYAFLREAAAEMGADRIATAHNRGDNAETVLFRMARGTGLRGLTGIPAERDGLVRPLLGFSRGEIEAYLKERGIPWREDATNALDEAARNRIRHHVLPALEAAHPGAEENIARMCATLAEDEAYLNGLAAERLRLWGGESLPAAELAALPRPVAVRVLRLWLGEGLTRERTEAVLALCRGGPSAAIQAAGQTVRREYTRLLRVPATPATLREQPLSPGTSLLLPEAGLTVRCRLCGPGEEIQSSFNTFSFSCVKICDKLTVGPRREGDRLALLGRTGTRSVKKLMIDARIPSHRRRSVPVLRDAARPLAVWGFGQCPESLPGPGESFYRVTIRESTEGEKE